MKKWHSPDKPSAPFRVVTHGSLQYTVERFKRSRGRWGYQDWEPVAWCTSRQLAEQIYSRRMMGYVKEALR